MFFRFIRHISKRTLHATGLTILLIVVLFFSLTRTQVGRDALSRQIVTSVNNAFDGSFSIGKLTGNLLYTLYATDVTMEDPDGKLVVAIDSVIVKPVWIDLLRKRFSVKHIEIVNPKLYDLRDEHGISSIVQAFKPTSPDTTSSSGVWALESAVVRVRGGQYTSENEATLPSWITDDRVFNYTEMTVSAVELEARLDWTSDTRQLDLLRVSGVLDSQALSLTGGQGQILFDTEEVKVNGLTLDAGKTSLSASGSIGLGTGTDDWSGIPFALDVDARHIAFEEIQRLFPSITATRDTDVSVHVQGPIKDATLSWLRIDQGETHVELSGTVRGLPDVANFEGTLSASALPATRLSQWLPDVAAFQRMRVDTVGLNIYADGTVNLEPSGPILDISTTIDLVSNAGALSASTKVRGTPGDSLSFDIISGLSDVNLASWTGNDALSSSISGSLKVESSGLDYRSATATVSANFRDFRLGRTAVADLDFDAQASSGSFASTLRLNQNPGVLRLESTLNLNSTRPEYSMYVTSEHTNLGTLLGQDSLDTELNLAAQFAGSGLSENELLADLAVSVDSSLVTVAGQSSRIIPHSQRVEYRHSGPDSTLISLRGDIVDADIEGVFSVSAIVSLATAWANHISNLIRDEIQKPLYDSPVTETVERDLKETIFWQSALSRLEKTVVADGIAVGVSAKLKRSDIISSYWPLMTPIRTSGLLSIRTDWTTEQAQSTLIYETDSLRYGSFRLDGSKLDAAFRLGRTNGIDEALRMQLTVESDSMSFGGQNIVHPALQLGFNNGIGSYELNTNESGRLDSLLIDGRLRLRSDRNSLEIGHIQISGGRSRWVLEEAANVDLFSDALIVNNIHVIQRSDGASTGQSFRTDGTYSSSPVDTLRVRANGINLFDVSQFFAVDKTIGGYLDAVLNVTTIDTQPRVQGSLSISKASLENRILGDLSVISEVSPGSPDIGIHLDLTPVDSLTDPVISGTDIPAAILTNALTADGRIELPRKLENGNEFPGRIEASVKITRADLFFFEYIFNETRNVSGFVQGGGTIGGSVFKPEFDITATVNDGVFSVPKIGLTYRMSGNVRVDKEAIHLSDFAITDPSGGVGRLDGRMLFNDYQFFAFDVAGSLDRFQVMNLAFSDELPFYGFIWASGTLTIDGPLFGAKLRSTDAVTTENSRLFIPVVETAAGTDNSYIVFADSVGQIPDFRQLSSRPFLLAKRPDSERRFIDALDMDLNITAPPGSTIHLVMDPLLGDVINAVGSGLMQIRREQGDFSVFGQLHVSGGDYQFTAGEVFYRKFVIASGGTITWSGDPINAALDIPATYRTRASRAGLDNGNSDQKGLIPLIINLKISGTVDSPAVDLSLAIDRSNQNVLGDYQAIEAQLNQPDRATEYATSVLLTNSFQLTTDNLSTNSGGQLAFNSVSQLVSSQVNRFVNEALPNVDFSFGLQGENAQNLDVTYGVAFRLMDERLIIRGEGIYQASRSGTDNVSTRNEGLQGEFVVEVRLSPTVSVEVFFRREGDILQSTDLTSTAGAGLTYQTEFSAWKQFWHKLFGWITPDKKPTIGTETNEATR